MYPCFQISYEGYHCQQLKQTCRRWTSVYYLLKETLLVIHSFKRFHAMSFVGMENNYLLRFEDG